MTQPVPEHSDDAAAADSTAPWGRRLFVPAATVALVLIVARWIDARLDVDLLTAAQNDRLTFQTGGMSDVAGLKPAEIASASDVLQRDREIADDRVQVLYLGNSQTLAIMDRQGGDLTSPQWLQVLLSRGKSGGEVRLGSLPNMSTTEMLLQFAAAAAEATPNARCDVLVISLVLEEFRGVGIRQDMKEVAQRPHVRDRLRQLHDANRDLPAAGQAIADVLRQRSGAGDPSEAAGASAVERHRSWTDVADGRLGAIAETLPYVGKREQLVGSLGIQYMAARNKLLGITSSSARPVPEPTYRASCDVLELILRYAQARKTPVVVYLAPIRPIQPNPNVPADVERFRREMPQICAKYGVTCADFIDLVPEALWTNYPDGGGPSGGQRDFAHFTGAAHKLVAERLLSHVEAVVERAKTRREGVAGR